VCRFVGRNEARFGRQEDLGTCWIEAEPDNGLGKSGLGKGQELLGRAEDDRLVAGETPETPDRAGEDLSGWPRAQQSGAAREAENERRVAGRHVESPRRRHVGPCANELELADEPHFVHAHRLDGCEDDSSRSSDLDRVLRARVEVRHELLEEADTITLIGRPLPDAGASLHFVTQ
jgi:hypothetical protein